MGILHGGRSQDQREETLDYFRRYHHHHHHQQQQQQQQSHTPSPTTTHLTYPISDTPTNTPYF